MEARRGSGISPWVYLVVGLAVGAIAFGVIDRYIKRAQTDEGSRRFFATPHRVRVDASGNLVDPTEKTIDLSVSGHDHQTAIHWISPGGTTLTVTNVMAPGQPTAPELKVKPNPDDHHPELCITLPLSKDHANHLYQYKACVLSIGQTDPVCGTDPWIHVNP